MFECSEISTTRKKNQSESCSPSVLQLLHSSFSFASRKNPITRNGDQWGFFFFQFQRREAALGIIDRLKKQDFSGFRQPKGSTENDIQKVSTRIGWLDGSRL